MKQTSVMLSMDYSDLNVSVMPEFSMYGSEYGFTYNGWKFTSSSFDALLAFHEVQLGKTFAVENEFSLENETEFKLYVSDMLERESHFIFDESAYIEEIDNVDGCFEYNLLLEHYAPSLLGSVTVSLNTSYFSPSQVLEIVQGKVI